MELLLLNIFLKYAWLLFVENISTKWRIFAPYTDFVWNETKRDNLFLFSYIGILKAKRCEICIHYDHKLNIERWWCNKSIDKKKSVKLFLNWLIFEASCLLLDGLYKKIHILCFIKNNINYTWFMWLKLFNFHYVLSIHEHLSVMAI